MTSKNNKAPLLYYIKLCASFQIHWWIQTGVTVRKCSIRLKIGNFLSRVTLKFDRWPWKIIGLLFYTTLSFMQHFKAIGIIKLELQYGNSQFKNWHFFPGDFENWRMTLKNNRAPLLYYAKLCAAFQIHWLSQTWVTAWKRSSRVKIGDFMSRVTLKIDVWPWKTIWHLCYAASTFVHHFIANGDSNWSYSPEMPNLGKNWRFFSRVTLKFDGWPRKTIGHLFYTTLSFMHHFKAIGIFKLDLQYGNAQFGSKLAIFCPGWLWKLTYDLEKQ